LCYSFINCLIHVRQIGRGENFIKENVEIASLGDAGAVVQGRNESALVAAVMRQGNVNVGECRIDASLFELGIGDCRGIQTDAKGR